MHIADGIVSAPVLVGGTLVALGGVAVGLRKTDYEDMPKVAVLSAAFFVASLIHIPIGPGQVHLVLNGLAGIILGWPVFPALLIALFLQALLFGYGGITVLGINTLNMALPGLCCALLFRPLLNRSASRPLLFAAGFMAGSLAIGLSGIMVSATLYCSNRQFLGVAWAILLAHIPVAGIEGLLTGAAVVFLKKVNPSILDFRRK